MANVSEQLKPKGGSRVLQTFLVFAILLSLLGTSVTSTAHAGQRVQPHLLQMAAQQPDARVAVIVQKVGKTTGVEDLVARLGGVVTKDLHIINAFGAEVPAKAVTELGKSRDVRWVSMDAPVVQSGSPAHFSTWATDLSMGTPTTLNANFNSTAISAGRYVWFSAALTGSSYGTGVARYYMDDAVLQFTAGGATHRLKMPDATVTYDPAAISATSTYNGLKNTWETRVKGGLTGTVFGTGLGYKVPQNLPGGISNVSFTARFTTDVPGAALSWKWSAAVYTTFNGNPSSLGVKPCSTNTCSQYANTDQAGAPQSYKQYVTGGAMGTGGTNYTGTYSASQSPAVATTYQNPAYTVDSATGRNDTYGSGSNMVGTFTGFLSERTPGNRIIQVQLALRVYVSTQLIDSEDMKVTVSGNGVTGSPMAVQNSTFNGSVGGPSSASTLYVDITAGRTWRWSDFTNKTDPLKVKVDQSMFRSTTRVYYDAVGLRVRSDNGTDTTGSTPTTSSSFVGPQDTSKLSNVYNQVVRATDTWNTAPKYLQGQNMRVAVIDSGDYNTKDYSDRIVGSVNFNSDYHSATDRYGHGTFVTGVIAGDGNQSGGAYLGIAPQADIVTVRVSDDQGMSTEATVVQAMQWVYDNRAAYNIKVVNLSLNSSLAQSADTSPMCAAAEILWFSGVTVVVSAGNNGTSTLFPPANDPFVITVGATDDMGTVSLADDAVASFSAYGAGEDGVAKPDLVAPGTDIISYLPDQNSLTMSVEHPDNQVNNYYFRMSGTSMAAPMVSGAALLLLQDEPSLTPDQVKYRLKSTANSNATAWPGYSLTKAGAGMLDIYAAVNGTTTQSANTGLQASRLLWTGSDPVTWDSVNWNSVNWNSVNWNSVNWNSVNWNSVNWNSDYWGR